MPGPRISSSGRTRGRGGRGRRPPKGGRESLGAVGRTVPTEFVKNADGARVTVVEDVFQFHESRSPFLSTPASTRLDPSKIPGGGSKQAVKTLTLQNLSDAKSAKDTADLVSAIAASGGGASGTGSDSKSGGGGGGVSAVDEDRLMTPEELKQHMARFLEGGKTPIGILKEAALDTTAAGSAVEVARNLWPLSSVKISTQAGAVRDLVLKIPVHHVDGDHSEPTVIRKEKGVSVKFDPADLELALEQYRKYFPHSLSAISAKDALVRVKSIRLRHTRLTLWEAFTSVASYSDGRPRYGVDRSRMFTGELANDMAVFLELAGLPEFRYLQQVHVTMENAEEEKAIAAAYKKLQECQQMLAEAMAKGGGGADGSDDGGGDGNSDQGAMNIFSDVKKALKKLVDAQTKLHSDLVRKREERIQRLKSESERKTDYKPPAWRKNWILSSRVRDLLTETDRRLKEDKGAYAPSDTKSSQDGLPVNARRSVLPGLCSAIGGCNSNCGCRTELRVHTSDAVPDDPKQLSLVEAASLFIETDFTKWFMQEHARFLEQPEPNDDSASSSSTKKGRGAAGRSREDPMRERTDMEHYRRITKRITSEGPFCASPIALQRDAFQKRWGTNGRITAEEWRAASAARAAAIKARAASTGAMDTPSSETTAAAAPSSSSGNASSSTTTTGSAGSDEKSSSPATVKQEVTAAVSALADAAAETKKAAGQVSAAASASAPASSATASLESKVQHPIPTEAWEHEQVERDLVAYIMVRRASFILHEMAKAKYEKDKEAKSPLLQSEEHYLQEAINWHLDEKNGTLSLDRSLLYKHLNTLAELTNFDGEVVKLGGTHGLKLKLLPEHDVVLEPTTDGNNPVKSRRGEFTSTAVVLVTLFNQNVATEDIVYAQLRVACDYFRERVELTTRNNEGVAPSGVDAKLDKLPGNSSLSIIGEFTDAAVLRKAREIVLGKTPVPKDKKDVEPFYKARARELHQELIAPADT